MKKIIAIIIALILAGVAAFAVGFLVGEFILPEDDKSSTSSTAEKNKDKEKSDEADEETEEEKEELDEAKAVELYNRAYIEAKDWFTLYSPYCVKDDYFTSDEGEMRVYYAIGHDSIKSIDDLKEHLYDYFSVDFTDGMVSEYYIEKDGKLYQQCLIAGDVLPTYYLDETTAVLLDERENAATYEITVKGVYPDSYLEDGSKEIYDKKTVDYVFEDGKWVVDSGFKRTLYAPYEWSGEADSENN